MSSQASSTTTTKYLAKTKYLHSAVYSAVFLALVGMSTTSHAVTFGKTTIHSTQHEPLSATIAVTGVDPRDFDISMANRAIYQQMGLKPNAHIRVSFRQTSANSGQIVLKSSRPINDPFADIVLNVNNNKTKQFMPKTLLMPMSKNAQQVKSMPIIAAAKKVNLPKVSEKPAKPEKRAKPFQPAPSSTVAKSAPVKKTAPTEKTVSVKTAAATKATAKPAKKPTVTPPSITPTVSQPIKAQSKKQTPANKSNKLSEHANATRQAFLADKTANQKAQEVNQPVKKAVIAKQETPKKPIANKQAPTPTLTAKTKTAQLQSQSQVDTVANAKTSVTVVNETKASNTIKPNNTPKTETLTASNATAQANKKLTQEPPIGKLASDKLLLANKDDLQATTKNSVKPTEKTDSANSSSLVTATQFSKESKEKASQTANLSNVVPVTTNEDSQVTYQAGQAGQENQASQAGQSTQATQVTYVVQRNDNLWTIAHEVAKRNNSSVRIVMQQIQTTNPNAFINGNANRLLADKTLVIPNYQTLPSQKSLEEAIAARRLAAARRRTPSSTVSTTKLATSQTTRTTTHSSNKQQRLTNTSLTEAPQASLASPNTNNTAQPRLSASTRAASTPKAHVSLVAPGSATDSTSSRTTGTAHNAQLLSALKNSRQTTARHASRVRQLNSQVSYYAQRLQLQNKKLAELEARLKQLKKA